MSCPILPSVCISFIVKCPISLAPSFDSNGFPRNPIERPILTVISIPITNDFISNAFIALQKRLLRPTLWRIFGLLRSRTIPEKHPPHVTNVCRLSTNGANDDGHNYSSNSVSPYLASFGVSVRRSSLRSGVKGTEGSICADHC